MGQTLTGVFLGFLGLCIMCLWLRAGRMHCAAANDRTATCTGTKFCESHLDGHCVFPSYQLDRVLSQYEVRSPETLQLQTCRTSEIPAS